MTPMRGIGAPARQGYYKILTATMRGAEIMRRTNRA
jgi:hypothetical protein